MGTRRNLLLMSALACVAPLASARTGSDADFGYHVANDPLDTTGELYRVSVRHCRALEEAMTVLTDRHGWLISVEAPPVSYPGDLVAVTRLTTGASWGHCTRPVAFAVDYSAADPFQAVQAVIAAYNAADPPFTAKVGWCAGNLCVTGDTVKAPDGTIAPAVGILDTIVSPTGTTRRALLDDTVAQVSAATGAKITFDPSSELDAFLDQDAGVAIPPGLAAREVFARVIDGYNQQAFEAAWTRRTDEAGMHARNEILSKIHGQYIGYAHRQGLPQAQADAEWAVLRAQMEAHLTTPVAPAPAYTPGLGPGWAWSVIVQYSASGPREYWMGIRTVSSPDLLPWDDRLPGTVPAP